MAFLLDQQAQGQEEAERAQARVLRHVRQDEPLAGGMPVWLGGPLQGAAALLPYGTISKLVYVAVVGIYAF